MARPRKDPGAPPPPADKRSRFVGLAEKRMNNAIRSVRLVANLSNRAHYEFTDSDVKKIIGALTAEVDHLKRKFAETPSKTAETFKL